MLDVQCALSRFDGNQQIFSTVSEAGAELLGWPIWRPSNPQGLGNVREAIPGAVSLVMSQIVCKVQG